jgi:hypothetical protein
VSDFIDELKELPLSDIDRKRVERAEILLASGYSGARTEVRKLLLATSLATGPEFEEAVATALTAASNVWEIPKEVALAAFNRDLLDRKRENVAKMLTELREKT